MKIVAICRLCVTCCHLAVLTVAVISSAVQARESKTDEALVLVAQPGPWSAVSNLIGYQQRLWFANSVKYVNHNSADIYSYDSHTGTTRFERHLFSQDTGAPVVFDGKLHWPFEDGRFSSGMGEFMVTDGTAWQWRMLAPAQIFHVHAMTRSGDTLYAVTSGWRGGLQRSTDGGLSWQVIHDHPTPPARVSRFTSLANLKGQIFAGLTSYAQEGVKLFALDEHGLTPRTVWPPALLTTGLTTHGAWLYGLQADADGLSVWRTDGDKGERLQDLSGIRVRAFASGSGHVWAISAENGGGALWRSGDGQNWKLVQKFHGAEPVDVAVYAGHVHVGTIGPGDRGGLWGPPVPVPVEADIQGGPLSVLADGPPVPCCQVIAKQLDAALGGATDYHGYRQKLFAVLLPLTDSGSTVAADLLSARLEDGRWTGLQPMFGGGFEVPLQEVNQWYLLWALARLGQGSVPVRLLLEPWDREENSAQKYFHPASAAAWAVAQLKQNDPKTLSALVARLEQPRDPLWLRGDIVGALAALTGEWHGYDAQAWQDWWQRSGLASR